MKRIAAVAVFLCSLLALGFACTPPSQQRAGASWLDQSFAPFPITTTNQYTQPAVGGTVAVAFDSTTNLAPGVTIFVVGGGSYVVASVTDSTHAVLTNTGASGNAAPTAVIAGGARATLTGPAGESATTTTQASFTMPAASSTVSVTVSRTAALSANEVVYVASAGYFTVASITDPTHVVLTNLGAVGNAASSTTIASPQLLSPSGFGLVPGGDLGPTDGGITSQTVIGLQGHALQDGGVTGDMLAFNGTSWVRLPAGGTSGYVLKSAGTASVPSYGPPNQWITAFECDLPAQSSQSLSSDTTYTICSKTWTKLNSTNDNVAMALTSGTGLVIAPKQTTNIGGSTFNAPTLRIPLISLIPPLTLTMAFAVDTWISADNGAANNDQAGAGVMIYNGSYNNQVTTLWWRGWAGATNGYGVQTTVLQSNVAATSTSVNFTSDRVAELVFPAGILGGVASLATGSDADGGVWPADQGGLHFVAAPAIPASSSGALASASSGAHTVSDLNVFLYALRNGSGTSSYSATISRVRVRYLPMANSVPPLPLVLVLAALRRRKAANDTAAADKEAA